MSTAVPVVAALFALLVGANVASTPAETKTTDIAATSNITYAIEDMDFPVEDLIFGSASPSGDFKEEGDKLTVAGAVLFDPNGTDLSKNADTEIVKLVQEIESRSSVKISVMGHTDNVQSAKHNQQLSEKRAQAVSEALSQKLGSDIEIISVGKGHNEPVADNSTDQGRSLNRRVEVIVID